MTGCWPCSSFAYFDHKRERSKYTDILTQQAWSIIKDLLWDQKENSLSLAEPTRETPCGQDTLIVTARKTTQALFMWRRVRSITLQVVPSFAIVYVREKRWPFCPSQQLFRLLWLSCLDCTELTWLGKPRCLYGEKLTRLVAVANIFFGIRDLKANSELKVCAGSGIPKITLGITGLYKIVSGLRNCPKGVHVVAGL